MVLNYQIDQNQIKIFREQYVDNHFNLVPIVYEAGIVQLFFSRKNIFFGYSKTFSFFEKGIVPF